MSWECSVCGYSQNDETETTCGCGADRSTSVTITKSPGKIRNFISEYFGGFLFGSFMATTYMVFHFSGKTPSTFYESPKHILVGIIILSGFVGAIIGRKASGVVTEILRYF